MAAPVPLGSDFDSRGCVFWLRLRAIRFRPAACWHYL